ncbi:hypothetical protein [Priestia flexa]|uniref:hypothetical protein n=1 Tax=Priestia flexa TaxID=86664 RepID=UPI00288DCB4D|nr:hypothetical protein [Priestia flexa]MDT2046508.1 hypothetical protein [Priestia flexa]
MSLGVKKIILLILLVVCLGLLVVQFTNRGTTPTAKQAEETLDKLPAQETVNEKIKGDKEERKYRVYYITIDKVEDGRYYGTTKEGTGISFLEAKVNEPLPKGLEKGDIVKAYFDLEFSTNGIVKVEEVDEIPQE